MNTDPLESSISRSIQRAIMSQFPGALVRKRHGTQMGVAGDPDLFGCLPGGQHFEIEVKRPGHQPTDLQTARLEQWKKAGAIVGVAHDAKEALAILNEERNESRAGS